MEGMRPIRKQPFVPGKDFESWWWAHRKASGGRCNGTKQLNQSEQASLYWSLRRMTISSFVWPIGVWMPSPYQTLIRCHGWMIVSTRKSYSVLRLGSSMGILTCANERWKQRQNYIYRSNRHLLLYSLTLLLTEYDCYVPTRSRYNFI